MRRVPSLEELRNEIVSLEERTLDGRSRQLPGGPIRLAVCGSPPIACASKPSASNTCWPTRNPGAKLGPRKAHSFREEMTAADICLKSRGMPEPIGIAASALGGERRLREDSGGQIAFHLGGFVPLGFLTC